ncbi:MAG: gamma-glutamylcyclotransferase family protein [Burkholderiales bacterium]
MQFLFVYGTLRSDFGHPMAAALGMSTTRVGRAWSRGRLYDVGEYPGAVASASPADRVVGELHRIEPGREAALFAQLDRYEGWDPDRPSEREYLRVRTQVESEAGEAVEAWLYLYNRSTEGLAPIDSGDYGGRAPGVRQSGGR